MSFQQEKYISARTREIERIFMENKDAIRADLDSLDLSMRDIAEKYKVNDRNVRRWSEKLGIDPLDRSARRRVITKGYFKKKTQRPKQKDEVRSAKLLSMRW